MVRIRLNDGLDLGPGQGDARGGVGVGDQHVGPGMAIVRRIDGKILPKGDLPIGNMVQRPEHGVEPVGDVGEHKGVISVSKGQKGIIQNLVRPVGKQQVFRGHVQELCHPGLQACAGDVAIQVQRPGLGDPPGNAGGRGIGRFVGVQLHILLVLGLLTGHIGLKGGVLLAEKTTHASASSNRLSTLRAWPSRPSCRAKPAMLGLTCFKASAV